WHNFGADYDRTLQAWRDNIEAAWTSLPARYDARFRRKWRYYLAGSMARFRARRLQLWQLVLSPHGRPGASLAPRCVRGACSEANDAGAKKILPPLEWNWTPSRAWNPSTQAGATPPGGFPAKERAPAVIPAKAGIHGR